jgi:hypothetical protein
MARALFVSAVLAVKIRGSAVEKALEVLLGNSKSDAERTSSEKNTFRG